MDVVHNSLSINTIYIIIIIIIRHELCLDRHVLAWSNNLFKGLSRRLRQSGLQFSIIFASCCCSFLLHVVGSLICIFLVSQLVLLSTIPKILNFFLWSKGIYPAFWRISSRLMSIFSILFFLRAPNSLLYRRMGTTSALRTITLEIFWSKFGFYIKISFCINLQENTTDILHITMGKHTNALRKFYI